MPTGLTMDNWSQVDNMTPIKFRHNSCPFSLSSKNDLVLMGSLPQSAVIGVELKTDRDFNDQALRQGEVELYTWDSLVTYPFLQVVTDLCRGGVAYWCSEAPLQGSSPIQVNIQVLGTMKEVYDFVAMAVHELPNDLVQRRLDKRGPLPQELQQPYRVKIFQSQLGLAAVHEEPGEAAANSPGGGPPGGGGGPPGITPDNSQHSPKLEQHSKMPRLHGQADGTSARNQQLLCYLEDLLANIDDVANMRDVDEFY